MARKPLIPSNMAKKEITISELLRLVKRDYLDNERKSFYNLDKQIAKYLEPNFGKIAAEQLTVKQVEEYKSRRLSERAARATINLELSTLRRAGKLGQMREMIAKFPIVQLYPIGHTNRRTGFFEEGAFLEQCKHCMVDQRRVLRAAYLMGWRLSDLNNLRWSENYDKDPQCIRIFKSKNNKGRVFPLSILPELDDLIDEMKQARDPRCDWMFPYHGSRYDNSSFNRHWHKAQAGSSVENFFHDTRRTAVRNLIRAGVPRSIAKVITGHESDTVFERYDIVDENDIKNALTQLNNYHNSRKSNGNHSINNRESESPLQEYRAASEQKTPTESHAHRSIEQLEVTEDTIRHSVADQPTSLESHMKAIADLKEETTELGRYSRLLERLTNFMSRSRR